MNGSCSIPPRATDFTAASSQVWLFFDVTGAQIGDSALVNVFRPDGAMYTALNPLVSSIGQNGYYCFTYAIPISGAAAASYLGTWKIQAFWDQASTPLFTLSFTVSATAAAAVASLSPSSTAAGGASFTLTVNGSNFATGSVVQWNGTALPTTFVSSTQLQASVSSGLIAASGTASITVFSGGNVSGPATFTVSSVVPASVVAGLTNAASYAKDSNGNGSAVAPGSLVSIFGTYPGATMASARTTPFPLSLGGVSVTFNGVAAPLSAVVPTGASPEINAQVPFEVLPAGQTSGTASLVVTVNGIPSPPWSVPIVTAAPGVFTIPPTGQGNAILAFIDPADNTAKIAAPASANSSIGYPTAPIPIGTSGFFYVTGLGAMTPPLADGAADLTITHNANSTPIVMVGGVTAQVQFAGQAPGYPGVDQINIVIPSGAPIGGAVPLQVQTADGRITSTPGATTAIRAAPPAQSPQLVGLTLSPTSVVGGGFVTGILTLSGPAPAGGVNLTLSSDNSAAQLPVPPTLAVAAGQSNATFSIATAAVSTPQTATITASLGALTIAAILTISPGGPISVSITAFPVPSVNSNPYGIAAGPDGALWFTEYGANKIGKITPAGAVTEYSIPTPSANPSGIAVGPDGALWFTESTGNKIGRISTTGILSEYSVPTASSNPSAITATADGALWFTESSGNKIGRISTAGIVSEYAVPTANSNPSGIVAGPDGALWYTEYNVGNIGRITTAGVITEYPVPPSINSPYCIAVGPDGALWFTAEGLEYSEVARITTGGTVTNIYQVTPSSQLNGIAAGPDGALWFTDTELLANAIGRITTSGVVTEYPVPTPTSLGLPVAVYPRGIAAGPDGAVWFTEFQLNQIGRVALH